MKKVKRTSYSEQRRISEESAERQRKEYIEQNPKGKVAEDARLHKKKMLDQRKIKILVDENPKQQGSESRERFKLYKNGMTIKAFLDGGGKRIDITWDTKKGYIRLEERK